MEVSASFMLFTHQFAIFQGNMVETNGYEITNLINDARSVTAIHFALLPVFHKFYMISKNILSISLLNNLILRKIQLI